jgi:hypothetical protein
MTQKQGGFGQQGVFGCKPQIDTLVWVETWMHWKGYIIIHCWIMAHCKLGGGHLLYQVVHYNL